MGNIEPSSIRKKMKLMLEFEAQIKSTKLKMSHYSKHSQSELMGMEAASRKDILAREYILNSKNEGFNIQDFETELAKFIGKYFEENKLPELDANIVTILMS